MTTLGDAALCLKARAENPRGVDGPAGDSERALVARYARMCREEADDYCPRSLDPGDLESEALLALRRAIYTFDGKTETLRHWAKLLVRRALLDVLRRDRRELAHSAAFGLDDPLPGGATGTFGESLFNDPLGLRHEETTSLRDVLGRFRAALVRAYVEASHGPSSRTPEPLRRALEASALALATAEDAPDMEAFLSGLGSANGQFVLGIYDDAAAARAAVRLADRHLEAAARAAEGEAFRTVAAHLDPDAVLAALRIVGEASRPVSEEA